MERKLIDYLPYVVRDYWQYQGICASEQPEFETIWKNADEALDNQYVFTATAYGLAKLERMLVITPDATDSLETRRTRILEKLRAVANYTLPQVRNMLDEMCGTGNCTATCTDYTLTVTVGLAVRLKFDDVAALMDIVIPANIHLVMIQVYNTHGQMRPYTHEQLSAWTHNGIRTEENL